MLTRKRYKWDIKCESNERKTSARFFQQLASIRQFFYSIEELKAYPDRFFGHKHAGMDSALGSKDHNDFHLGDENFHLHVTGIVTETGRAYLLNLQGLIFVYECAVFMLIVYHVNCRPMIDASRRQLRC